jgi:hypothetical protein
MRIFSTYKPVSSPLGGANNFISALFQGLENKSVEFEYKLNRHIDFIFINQLSRGNGRGLISLFFLVKLFLFKKIYNKPILTRVVNLNSHAFNKGPRFLFFGLFDDFKTFILISISDHVVFQSEYQMEFFLKKPPFFIKKHSMRYHVVHNGADNFYCNSLQRELKEDDKLILVSNTFSFRKTKLHSLIANFSLLPNVEILHIGNWPTDVDSLNVKILGVLKKNDIRSTYLKAHFLLHPAIKDPCPNVLFEAILNGLPIIYNPDVGSSSEIVNNNGLPLNPDSLISTISEARLLFQNLIMKVNSNKSYYSIDRAIDEYFKIIKSVFN